MIKFDLCLIPCFLLNFTIYKTGVWGQITREIYRKKMTRAKRQLKDKGNGKGRKKEVKG
jgi:hypothetical protein